MTTFISLKCKRPWNLSNSLLIDSEGNQDLRRSLRWCSIKVVCLCLSPCLSSLTPQHPYLFSDWVRMRTWVLLYYFGNWFWMIHKQLHFLKCILYHKQGIWSFTFWKRNLQLGEILNSFVCIKKNMLVNISIPNRVI